MSVEVRTPGTSRRRTTRPPQLVTSGPPTIASSAQSPPLARTSGRNCLMSGSGVAVPNTTTQSTHERPAIISARWRAGTMGRFSPLSLRTLASEFTATTSRSPRFCACSKLRKWPTCNRSKQPFVKTTLSPARCAARIFFATASRARTCFLAVTSAGLRFALLNLDLPLCRSTLMRCSFARTRCARLCGLMLAYVGLCWLVRACAGL